MAQLSETTLAHMVRGGFLAGLGTLILVGGDAVLSRFLSPNVATRAMIGAGVLLLLGGVELYRAFAQAITDDSPGTSGGTPHNHADHDHAGGSLSHGHTGGGPLWALLLPLVMLPAAANSSSANIAANRLFTTPEVGVSQSDLGGGSSTAGISYETEAAAPFSDEVLPEIIYELLPEREDDGVFEFDSADFSLLPYVVAHDPDHFLGERVRMVGFVHREKGWPDNSFVLGRLSIWCCTADASLVGMWVSPKNNAPPTGMWLEVEGTVDIVDRLDFGDHFMETVPALKDASLRTVRQPTDEYTLAPVW